MRVMVSPVTCVRRMAVAPVIGSVLARPQPGVRPRGLRLLAKSQEDADKLEALFREELRRRGLDSAGAGERDGGGTSTSTSTSKNPFTASSGGSGARGGSAQAEGGDQRARSISLVNEGLEGLLPRAGELLKLGGSIFLAFVPFIAAISLLFGGVYVAFGDHFVHGGDASAGRPAYVDPAELLSEPTVDPYVPFQ